MPVRIEYCDLDTGAKKIATGGGDFRQWPLNTVEHRAEHPGAEFHGQRQPAAGDFSAGFQAGGVFEDLYGDGVLVKPDHLRGELVVADKDRLFHLKHTVRPGFEYRPVDPEHLGPAHSECSCDCAGDSVCASWLTTSLLTSSQWEIKVPSNKWSGQAITTPAGAAWSISADHSPL